ncbi:NADP-dependent isocitrate dehydrogenase [Bacteriovoracaceae bacterium]|nr:NADP-dependent isocitrate dehydrogenase [Bacteriovoracaceae bacterium]
MNTIIWTKTDEAPFLATQSFLPIVKGFTSKAAINIQTKDISLAGRVLANLSEYLEEEQKVEDALAQLGELAKKPEANIIKLPNISASIPQLKTVIAELQGHGFKIPNYPEEVKSDEDKKIKSLYSKVLGSAVNPVLREGNSDRRVAGPVKEFARKHPHSMGEWTKDNKCHVSHMSEGDFYGQEKSAIMPKATDVKISHVDNSGNETVLKEKTELVANEMIDASVMSKKSLCSFFEKEIQAAKNGNFLFSLHMKATMMKVSDPIIFGHCVKVFYKDVFEKYQSEFEELGVNANNGLGDVYSKIQNLSADKRSEIESAIQDVYKSRPAIAMVDSDKGITNLHVPSDVIIDASMPAAIRTSGMMWNKDGKLQETKSVIPDRSYASVYQEVMDFCRENGAFDVKTMGNVANVGLMAKKAEEYGSHDKTFEVPSDGIVKVTDSDSNTVFEFKVEKGDIWRMCQTKDIAVKDWVKLGVTRAKLTGNPAVFWLDENRAHDANLISKVNEYLKDHDTANLEIKILDPAKATRYSCERMLAGKDTISVTGNVLRDYLTDLFPILELGTSAKMLSIVPLLAGGGLFETGAGGSAPKHVQQLVEENHLRWDSLGEFLALAVSLEDLAEKTNNKKAKVLAECLDKANSLYLNNNKSPSRKVNELDNRGSHFYVALYWAQELAKQTEDSELASYFSTVAENLFSNEEKIVEELNKAQGTKVDIGGYFYADEAKLAKVMRPSQTLNSIIDSL